MSGDVCTREIGTGGLIVAGSDHEEVPFSIECVCIKCHELYQVRRSAGCFKTKLMIRCNSVALIAEGQEDLDSGETTLRHRRMSRLTLLSTASASGVARSSFPEDERLADSLTCGWARCRT